MKVAVSSWFPYQHLNAREQTKLNLFCFPCAGGSASSFRSWMHAFPGEIAVYPVQFPGREQRHREQPYTSISPLIVDLAQAIQPYLTAPYAFLGHSMGALIGYELASYLRDHHATQPQHLFLAAASSPAYLAQQQHTQTPIDQLEDDQILSTLPQQQNSMLREVLNQQNFRALFLSRLRADCALVYSYRYSPGRPLSCPITLFGGRQDSMITNDQLTGWADYTQGRFSIRMVEGDHFFLFTATDTVVQMIVDLVNQP